MPIGKRGLYLILACSWQKAKALVKVHGGTT
jgi:hypothetical protein